MRSFREHLVERKEQALEVIRFLQTENPSFVMADELFEISNMKDFVYNYLLWKAAAVKIGAGEYSTAYAAKDKKWVLKISRDADWYDPTDEYIALAQKHAESNSLFPKILWAGEKWGHKFTVLEYVNVLMEHELGGLVGEYYERPMYLARDLSMLVGEAPQRCLLPAKDLDKVLKSVGTSYEGVLRWADICKKNLPDFLSNLDLHAGNMGVRPNGSLAIFDPVA